MSPVYHDGNGKWWYCRDNALDAGPFATEREAWEAYDAYCMSQRAANTVITEDADDIGWIVRVLRSHCRCDTTQNECCDYCQAAAAVIRLGLTRAQGGKL